MNCERVRQLLPRYADDDLDEDLDDSEVEALSQHLQVCDDCRERLTLDRQLAQALSSLPEPALAPNAPDAWRARLRQEMASGTRGRTWHRATATSANALAAAIGLVLIGCVLGVVVLASGSFLGSGARRATLAATAATTPPAAARTVPADTSTSAPPAFPGTGRPLSITRVQPAMVTTGAPLGASPEKVTFADARHGWVLDGDCTWPGANGCSVLATADGGATWAEQFHTTLAVPEIFVLDDSHGWLLVSNCPGAAGACPTEILRTTDGGWPARPSVGQPGMVAPGGVQALGGLSQTWLQVGSAKEDLSDLQFLNPLDGWALGRACPPSRDDCTMKVMQSTDGGATWNDATSKQFTPVALRLVDPFNGWAVGCSDPGYVVGGDCRDPAIWGTRDSGRTWLGQLNLPPQYAFAAFVAAIDRMHAWVLLSDTAACDENAGDCRGITWGLLYHTSDGGWTWESVRAGTEAGTPADAWIHLRDARSLQPTVLTGAPAGLRFASPDLGWIPVRAGSGNLRGGLLLTKDGGTSWFFVAGEPGWSVDDVAVGGSVSGAVTWAVGTRRVTSGQVPFLVKSTDLGQRWQQVLPVVTPITTVDFLNPVRGWGIGSEAGAGRIFSTTDGGQTWTMLVGLQNAAALSFVDPLHGWVAGDDGSPGGGTVWSPGAQDLSFDPWTAAALGARNVLETDDGGHGWRTVYRGWGQIVWLRFFDRVHGLLVTLSAPDHPGPGLLATSDGGATWSWKAGISGVAPVLAVDFPNPRDGWVAVRTDAGTVELRTTDNGGLSWTTVGDVDLWTFAVSHGGAVAAVGLSFDTPRDGWLGFANVLLRTTDGGRTWSEFDLPDNLPRSIDVASVRAVSERAAWLTTTDRRLLETDDGGATWRDLPTG
ncbi:MAG TPA: YCF48-related protein [Chloroflexota bacterium]|nr:YCF48-related protein [Chloroflexota bacterium]